MRFWLWCYVPEPFALKCNTYIGHDTVEFNFTDRNFLVKQLSTVAATPVNWSAVINVDNYLQYTSATDVQSSAVVAMTQAIARKCTTYFVHDTVVFKFTDRNFLVKQLSTVATTPVNWSAVINVDYYLQYASATDVQSSAVVAMTQAIARPLHGTGTPNPYSP